MEMADDREGSLQNVDAGDHDDRDHTLQGLDLSEDDLACPICISVLSDPLVTPCGHTFCYSCISTHLQTASTCPSCTSHLTKELVYPNYLLRTVAKRASASAALRGRGAAFDTLQQTLARVKAELDPLQVDALVASLLDHKRECEQRQRDDNLELLLHFLQYSREDKARRVESLHKELQCLQRDITRVEASCMVPPEPRQAQQAQSGQPSAVVHAMQQAALAQAQLQQHAPPRAKPAAPGVVPVFHAQPPAVRSAAAAATAAVQQRLGPGYSAAACDAFTAHPGMATYMATQQPALPVAAVAAHAPSAPAAQAEAGSGAMNGGAQLTSPGLIKCALVDVPPAKKRRLASQFEDLQGAYLRLRSEQLSGDASAEAALPQRPESGGADAPGRVGAVVDCGLEEFSRMLSVLARCNQLRTVAEIPRPSLRQSSSIISSVEFDRDGALFATAGVSKRISIFEHAAVVGTPGVAVHCPIVELVTRSKLSCLSWNRYVGAHLASSDYEGVVTLWDVHTSGMLQEWEAHGKRIWSVDFCDADPTLLASGSDDCTVKLWSTRSPNSLAQLDLKANVCAVKWRPGSTHEVAVGSADHAVYLYDLRQAAQPTAVFTGHRKAVSYVRFASQGELVSASTDSTVRLWNLEAPPGAPAERVYEGHANEKNFVGLAVEGDFLACGSEANEAYVYYKPLSKPVAHQSFPPEGEEAAGGVGRGEPGPAASSADSDRTFISAVCWRPGTQELVVANSQGTVRVMELTGGS